MMTFGRMLGHPTVPEPYKLPRPDFPFVVSGTHPTIGYLEFGVTGRKNAEESAEALRQQGYRDVKVQERG
jgi:hypothetical protein